MSDNDAKYLDAFAGWLRTLGEDAEALSAALGSDASQEVKESVTGGLNYLFKSLDLIPDGIDDIGYLDDAFVLRVAAALAKKSPEQGGAGDAIDRLAGECGLVEEFLGDAYARIESYVVGLRSGAARGRTVADILSKEAMLEEFLSDVKGFNSSYEAPGFNRDPKNLIKLKAFFDAKLPKS